MTNASKNPDGKPSKCSCWNCGGPPVDPPCEVEVCLRFVVSQTETTQESPILYADGSTDVVPSGGMGQFLLDAGYTTEGGEGNTTYINCVGDLSEIFVFTTANDGSGTGGTFPTPGTETPYQFTAVSDVRVFIDSFEICDEELPVFEEPEPTTKWCSNTILWVSTQPDCFFTFGGVTVPDNGSQQQFVIDYNAAAADEGSPHSFELTDSSEICYTGTGEFGPDSEICRVDERGEVKGCTTFEEVPA